ncbi:hypothetical protein DFQ28_001595 [Apophysomyces sp. BC1034]|nr:hypothetical protein DFQ30_008030 [Apophysomyces sp. BC1015]KAG0178428.1 hypothetical protein DFQ29_003471 [Apophysomyces sp. BC1021]KAG0194103.1 hypothetical protein DFQ28_001595 [Apophysomyces sp. BC1034]
MFLLDMTPTGYSSSTRPSKRKQQSEARAAAKEKKSQQNELESLQITFYEIESWIEKTTPVLARMTRELDKASHQLEKRRKHKQPVVEDHPLSAMQWSLSFQPGNSMRLETNITSIDQLVDAVQKMRLLTDPDLVTHPDEMDNPPASSCSSSSSTSSASSALSSLSLSDIDHSTEYWNTALCRRPQSCLDRYAQTDKNLSRLAHDVSPAVLKHVCQVYWDCLHPKFSADWSTFWDRSGDTDRNQVCIDSGLAMVFLHIVRHDKEACANAEDIAYYYYERAREALTDFFDSPDCATLETLLNLAMFSILCKRHSQARIYIDLAYRMMLEMGMLRKSRLPQHDLVQRKKYVKLYMVLFYNDIIASVYSGEPAQVDHQASDIEFYEIISLNESILQAGEACYDDKTIAKETFHAHLLELAKVGKRTLLLVRDYQSQPQLAVNSRGELPEKWARATQELEIALAIWFDRLPECYRTDPKASIRGERIARPDAQTLREQSALLLMLQYQTQWIALHKTFLSLGPANNNRSHAICTDAARRIVVIAEIITWKYGWCVCQLFLSCIYQASTIFCRNALARDDEYGRQSARAMLRRIIRVLQSSRVNYRGLPDDLTACLNEFLINNGMEETDDGFSVFDQFFSSSSPSPDSPEMAYNGFNDTLPNSPHMHRHCLLMKRPQQQQHQHHQHHVGLQQQPTEAMLSMKLQEQSAAETMDFQPDTNWRYNFSSWAQVNHRVM